MTSAARQAFPWLHAIRRGISANIFEASLCAENAVWQDRAHFFALSAQMMRRILVDSARARASAKRGGGRRVNHSTAIDFDAIPDLDSQKGKDVIALDDALMELEKLDSRKARVIELRYFGGLSVDETAEVLKISPQSVLRDWKLAKAWLLREMSREQ
jgi:RNA polymerase sigma-70 factor, ECF subfamily